MLFLSFVKFVNFERFCINILVQWILFGNQLLNSRLLFSLKFEILLRFSFEIDKDEFKLSLT